jgi:hypothetical protein
MLKGKVVKKYLGKVRAKQVRRKFSNGHAAKTRKKMLSLSTMPHVYSMSLFPPEKQPGKTSGNLAIHRKIATQ